MTTFIKSAVIYGVLFSTPVLSAPELHYEGSSTVGKFITDATQVYTAAHFTLNTVPESAGGEQCAMRATCDIGGVAREVRERFLKRGVHAVLFAKDAIAAIVHVDNPVNELSMAQLKGIFTGGITNWSEVGGPNLPIRVLVVKKASATRRVFAEHVLGDAEYGSRVITVNPDAKIISRISRDKSAIGQLSLAFLVGKDEIKPLTIDGQTADVNNPDYPITRPLHMATKGEPKGEVKAFIDWALSPEGQSVVKKRFVGVR
jgi:phosphate transport system substrate-binding protein